LPGDFRALGTWFEKNLSQVILHGKAAFDDAVGHMPGWIKFDNLFYGIKAVRPETADSTGPVFVGCSLNLKRRVLKSGPLIPGGMIGIDIPNMLGIGMEFPANLDMIHGTNSWSII